ncbi:hypothetical protein [Halegenticoccus tardaugens]|uniref:hypothetical protein n=1 Tax=Halegenticoccus tardaugens TaxID=2071624 RepID=UPI001E3E38C5|nr:hypothetical protein [Halegenticoccus tardaugens]
MAPVQVEYESTSEAPRETTTTRAPGRRRWVAAGVAILAVVALAVLFALVRRSRRTSRLEPPFAR